MKRVDRYLLAESLPPLFFGLLLYSTLAVISMTIPRLQWVVGVPLGELLIWLALQFPTAVVQTLPIAIVLAVLLAFGRLAAGNELLALQAAGVSIGRMSRSFVVLGLVAALSGLALNQWVLPAVNDRVSSLYRQVTAGGSALFRLASLSIPIDGFILNFERVDRSSDELFGVRIERWGGGTLSVVFADRAVFEARGLRLYGYRTAVLDLPSVEPGREDRERSLQRLLRAHSRGANPESSLLLTMSTGSRELVMPPGGGGLEDSSSISQAYRAAYESDLSASERLDAAVLFHRKLAEPFASLVLLLVALPLSLGYARSRSVAFGLSLVVTLGWYLLVTVGQLLAQTSSTPVWLGVWLANILLASLGLFLLARRVIPR